MIRNEGNPQVTHSIEAGNDSKLTFSNFVANFRTLLTMLRSSFFSGFFSIFRYKFIWRRKKVRTKQREIQFDLMIYLSLTSLQSFTMAVIRQDCWCVALCVCQDFSIRMCVCVCTCSVSRTEALLYFWLVSAPSVASRSRKMRRAAPHTSSSQLLSQSRNVWWLFSTYNHKTHATYGLVLITTLRNHGGLYADKCCLTCAQMVNAMDRARRKMEETMTSTERWGPRLCKTKHISGIWHVSICRT